jgi:hypothetical protein
LEKPLTLTLSRRERGLTEGLFRGTPTCDTEPNFSFEQLEDWLPFPSRFWGEGTDRGVLSRYADVQYRAELRFWIACGLLPFPLAPLGERAGVRGRLLI